MRYVSTRGRTDPLSFTEAVAMGLAPDGGLLIPERLPDLSVLAQGWETLSYEALCFEFFKVFATDIETSVLHARIQDAYSRFDHPEIAPLKQLSDDRWVLELFHGPTLAFKDFALQLLGNFYEEQIQRTGEAINVLGATSGDTGAAAIHGLLGKKGVNIFILYPEGGVSPLQERQMTCTGADNVYAIAIDGAFDDAQTTIKEVFGDLEFRKKYNLSAINSINLARVLAQCVYYLYAYFRLPATVRNEVEFVVPTGNFGNVLAGWLVQQMGIPLKGFCVATNQNDILYRLFETGDYSIEAVHPSVAPSMDIQIASNFERFLYFHEGKDPVKTTAILNAFKATGRHYFEQFNRGTFRASRATDAEIGAIIERVKRDYNYIVDPHTACGFADLKEGQPAVILGTAHPAKFPDTIASAIGETPVHSRLEALKERKIVKYPSSASADAIRAFIAEKA